ncbi:MAG: right-handed parallel beta-helix repeat-containing protein [Acidobacteriota bacterium]
MRLVAAVAVVFCLAGAQMQAQRPDPSTRVPNPGIPNPSFGLTERAGAATYFVDNTNPAATDTSNPNGTAARPRRTVPSTALPAGAVVEVRGGPYDITRGTWYGNGTAASPVFIKGVGDPIIRGDRMVFGGSYLSVESMIFDDISLVMDTGTSHFALRYSIIHNWTSSGPSAAMVPAGSDIVVFGNEITANGDPNSAQESDIHGIKIEAGASKVWVLLNHIHHNGGDGIQLGNATSPEPWPQQIYIAQNTIHEDRENAVDIKKARDVVVSSNIAYGYESRSSSSGEIFVTHDGAQRIWIIDNAVGSSRQGIVCTGATDYAVVGNVINGIRHNPADTAYDPNSVFRAAGILTYNSTNTVHINNTIWDSDSGISYASGTAATLIVNNIIGNLAQPSFHIAIPNSQALAASVVSNNIVMGEARLRLGSGGSRGCQGSECVNADPLLTGAPRSFRPAAGSPAIDKGATPGFFAAFERMYGQSIAVDLLGVPRPQGAAFDIGAIEVPAGTPPSPRNVRIIPKTPAP